MVKRNGIKFYDVGEEFTGFMLIKDVRKGVARNNKDFLSVTIGDKTGEVKVMVWDLDEEKEGFFKVSNIIKVRGNVTEFKGVKQLNLKDVREVQEEDKVKITDFVEVAPKMDKEVIRTIYESIEEIENDKIREITEIIFKKHFKKFRIFPAARRVHHAYIGGLAYHTYCMLNMAKKVLELYPILNEDLLIAGVILHDIQKINDYEFDGVSVTGMTKEGQLLGHIVQMVEEIGQTAKELGIEGEEVLLLKTMVASHHGLHENGWGSAVSPKIVEAEVLHMIDVFDAKLEQLRKEFENVEVGEFTERMFTMDNRSFYKHKLSK